MNTFRAVHDRHRLFGVYVGYIGFVAGVIYFALEGEGYICVVVFGGYIKK